MVYITLYAYTKHAGAPAPRDSFKTPHEFLGEMARVVPAPSCDPAGFGYTVVACVSLKQLRMHAYVPFRVQFLPLAKEVATEAMPRGCADVHESRFREC